MSQIVTQLDEDLVRQVDQLVKDGTFESRSEAVRVALAALVDTHRRRRTSDQIVASYTAQPQDETWWADEATVRMIAEEPW
ncbi:MAG: ribbon-helix-helix domain-containing protein [Acidimicrobiia bacterium]